MKQIAAFTSVLLCSAALLALDENAPDPGMPAVEGPPGGGPIMMAPHVGSAELEMLKGMIGRWETDDPMEKAGNMANMGVEYHLTANGSAVVERTAPGTPMEMMSVYHDTGGVLTMTHYCMLGNQPRMKLESASGDQLTMSFDGTGVDDPDAPHMRSVTIAFNGPDEMSQTWAMNEGGDKAKENTMVFHRVQ